MMARVLERARKGQFCTLTLIFSVFGVNVVDVPANATVVVS